MHKKFLLSALALCLLCVGVVFAATAGPATPQPVFILLYSRFYDHSIPRPNASRLQRLLPMLERLRQKYPEAGVSALLQFSGTTSQVLDEMNPGLHLIDKAKELQRAGLVDLGYTGDQEPSPLYRPKPNFLLANSPEEKWSAGLEATEHFLNDFKNPVTGLPFDGLSGGLKRTQEVFGPAAFISGANPLLLNVGGDSWATHAVRRMNPTALMEGIPAGDVKRGISNFPISADLFSKMISPIPESSPEVYWQDGALRLSDTSLSDLSVHTTDDAPDALKKFFGKLDRKNVRIVKLEVESYRRYLNLRPDGSLIADPLEWMYYHPDDPQTPITMKPLVELTDVNARNKKEDEILKWLLEEFLPANPGSRFISIHDLSAMAQQQKAGAANSSEISSEQLKAVATDLVAQIHKFPQQAPNFVTVGDQYYSLADAFVLLAQALAAADQHRPMPAKLKLNFVYGPIETPDNNMGSNLGPVTVAEVAHKAAELLPRLTNDQWKPLPDNVVPASVQIGSRRVNAIQFLRMMAEAYLDPTPDRVLRVNAMQMSSSLAFMYPKNTPMSFQGIAWTTKPAPLHYAAAEAQGVH
jgi:Ca2+-binding EF-hand superfamily protein